MPPSPGPGPGPVSRNNGEFQPWMGGGGGEMFCSAKGNERESSIHILCLIPRTTVTSLSAPKNTRCKMHPLCVNPGFRFERVRKQTSCVRDLENKRQQFWFC